MPARSLALFTFALALVLAACGGPAVRPGADTPGAEAPAAAVERFLHLAAEADYRAMGWVFGTESGSVLRRDAPGEVDKRMSALAAVLRHERFGLTGVVPVSGRPNARQVNVQLVRSGRTHSVPFMVVEGPAGRWYVQQVSLQSLTGGL